VFVKRDDLTGFGLGGNKVRKLDYLLADARAKQADTVVTKHATSFSRNAAMAGPVLGLDVHVVIGGEASTQNRASQSLFERAAAELHFATQDDVDARYDELVTSLRTAGRHVYELHPGGSDEIGSLAYMEAFDEIVAYSEQTGVHFGTILHATGSTATQVGLVLGQCLAGYDTRIVGVAISQPEEIQRARVLDLARRTAAALDVSFDENRVVVDDGYIGPGYPIPSEEGRQASRLFARHEGILLDPPYTAKAAAALVDYAASGRFADGKNVLFVHTGGNAGVYY
jgi:1-aminocyclopropane-1-carboxylate deaminase/D-cysteine desulfhydrase-like pyridoxal-dependent ACC family enzyme